MLSILAFYAMRHRKPCSKLDFLFPNCGVWQIGGFFLANKQQFSHFLTCFVFVHSSSYPILKLPGVEAIGAEFAPGLA